MKINFSILYSFILFLISLNNIYAGDLRDLNVGSSIEEVPERGYVNLSCEDNTKILKWSSFKKTPTITM